MSKKIFISRYTLALSTYFLFFLRLIRFIWKLASIERVSSCVEYMSSVVTADKLSVSCFTMSFMCCKCFWVNRLTVGLVVLHLEISVIGISIRFLFILKLGSTKNIKKYFDSGLLIEVSFSSYFTCGSFLIWSCDDVWVCGKRQWHCRAVWLLREWRLCMWVGWSAGKKPRGGLNGECTVDSSRRERDQWFGLVWSVRKCR